jgi:hypothetical protein
MADWFPNAYSIEIAQAAGSIAATLILLWTLYDAAKDASGLPTAERFGPRGAIAIGNIHRAVFRVLMSMLLTGAGLASMFLPPPPPPLYRVLANSPEMRLGAIVVRGVLIAVTAILLVDGFSERFFRHRYVRSLRASGRDVAPRAESDRRRSPKGSA